MVWSYFLFTTVLLCDKIKARSKIAGGDYRE